MSLQVKELEIGKGLPKICVPITGLTKEEILNQGRRITAAGPDLVEWRADFYKEILTAGKVEEMLETLSDILGEIPILFTFRTAGEGGNREISTEEYCGLNLAVADQNLATLIDVEVYKEGLEPEEFIEKVHQRGGMVVASNHHFDQTPYLMEMIEILTDMEEMKADILKLAVMPKAPEDVLNLLQATRRVSAVTPRPVVTMSMGKLGVVSRISGGTFGSAITFATVGEASAPGQIPLEEMRKILISLNK